MRLSRIMSLVILMGLSWPADAHDTATGIVKERMDMMKSIAGATKAIGQIVKGQQPHDEAIIRDAARIIAEKARHIPDMFPAHSLDPPSEASPEIWLRWDSFLEESRAMGKAAAQIATAAEQPEQMRQHFITLGETCKSCHKSYRIKP